MTNDIAEREINETTLRSIAIYFAKYNKKDVVTPKQMPKEIRAHNQHLTRSIRATHEICDRHSTLLQPVDGELG